MSPRAALILLAFAFTACARSAPVDLAADRAALLTMHEQVLASHRTDDVDAWLALEADSLVIGNRGELFYGTKAEAEGRRRYLAATEFSVYRDLQPPIVKVSDDGSLGWVIAQVEIVGRYLEPDTASIHDVWTWIELYERRPEGWRAIGNVSTVKP
ncbi:MAG: hypothetical protein L0Z51_09775 [Candidatus Latescibacteria bacterium]|nr:hypothetical protein [Candidatus Latescibacterota bacterium]